MRGRTRILLATAMLAASHPIAAQVGSSTDILTGRVTGPAGQALQGVRVEATSIETGVTRSRATDAQGRYTILFPDGAGAARGRHGERAADAAPRRSAGAWIHGARPHGRTTPASPDRSQRPERD